MSLATRSARLSFLLLGSSLLAPAFGQPPTEEITVTASRENLIGIAQTASEGSVTQEELALRPVYRVGQLLETVPGLVVTIHSGEGKANQYLLRGVNLDHGIDFANFIDDMPINRPSNTHGQGYSDLNFILPELLGGLDYTKGPYYAELGDFGAVGSEHLKLLDDIPNQVSTSIGTAGDEELFGAGTLHFDDGSRLLGGAEISHLDGPWDPGENYRKIALAGRYSSGKEDDGYSLTALYYKAQGRNITDQPQRAILDGTIGLYGTLDPTDGSDSNRWSLSGHYGVTGDDWRLKASAYYIHSTMTLWNDFTHYLNDPANGDQEQQDETRDTLGFTLAYSHGTGFFGLDSETTIGLQERYDAEYVDRRHTADRVVLDYCNDGDGPYSVGDEDCSADLIHLNDLAPYISNTTHWLSWLRTTLGVREDWMKGTDQSLITDFDGSAHEFLFQPKANIAFGPWYDTEFYISAGKGFHSDDIRGVLGAVPVEGTQLSLGRVPLMARTYGEEFGIRNASIPGLQLQLALFRQDYGSEEIYDADAGLDQATAPSRREGFEFSAQYHPYPWLELNTDVSATKAHYFLGTAPLENFYKITGGTNIANAPKYTASFGALFDHIDPWSGSIEERILGPEPLTDGPNSPRGRGYAETNVEIGYKLDDHLKLEAAIFNLFDQKAYAAEFYYATKTAPNEVATNDFQAHPLEPISARFTLTWLF
jgi:outer membrane receptor protein involved in Fe transport